MYTLTNTDLVILGKDEDDYLAILIKKNSSTFNADALLEDLSASADKVNISDEEEESELSALLNRYDILEIWTSEEIQELTDQGELDPDDLHSSMLEYFLEDDEDLDAQ